MPHLQTLDACVDYAVNELALDFDTASELVASVVSRNLGDTNLLQFVQKEINSIVLGSE
jgi:hypothetical protein